MDRDNNNQDCSFSEIYPVAKKDSTKTGDLAKANNYTIEALIATDGSVACQPGCSFCCHLRVAAFTHEIIGIFQELHSSQSPEQLDETKQRVNDQYDVIKTLSADERRQRNIACPLLIDEQCSVHSVRPIACAGHHSTDATICRNAFMHPDVTVITYEHPGIPMIQSIKTGQSEREQLIRQHLSGQAEDSEKHELIASLKQLFDNPLLIQHWQKGEKIFY